jgi:hypothetical protein
VTGVERTLQYFQGFSDVETLIGLAFGAKRHVSEGVVVGQERM